MSQELFTWIPPFFDKITVGKDSHTSIPFLTAKRDFFEGESLVLEDNVSPFMENYDIREIEKIEKIKFTSCLEQEKRDPFKSTTIKNIPVSILCAVKRGCESYFHNVNRGHLECISRILEKLNLMKQRRFQAFIVKYDCTLITIRQIKKFLNQEGDDIVCFILINLVKTLLENDEDIDEWLQNSKISPKNKQYIKRNKTMIKERMIYHVLNKEFSHVLSESGENSGKSNLPGHILLIIFKGMRNFFRLEGESFPLYGLSDRFNRFSTEQKFRFAAFMQSKNHGKTWKRIRERARNYQVTDLLRDLFAELLLECNSEELSSALLHSRMLEKNLTFIIKHRFELRTAALKYLN